jgi:polygalacturonase
MGGQLKARRTFCIPPAAVFALIAILILTDGPTVDSATNLTSKPTPFGSSIYDVRAVGARGDGKTIDTPAINKAIESASAAGGGTVRFPAGIYLCFSIHLKSHITLYLDQGATILAAASKFSKTSYDPPEPNEWDLYQDFGHSHWQNSLIWGIGLEDVSVLGPGRIDGNGLTRRSPRPRRPIQAGDRPTTLGDAITGARVQSPLGEDDDPSVMNGLGNKAISLKLCRNVVLRDFAILNGGHFAVLATGVDNLTIDNVKVDTNRDGFDIDSCRNVRISNCSLNSPNDDAIVLKSSYALGLARATKNVTMTNCFVSGYDIGSLLDATYKRNVKEAPDHDGPTGRLKFGTESNGGFKNIVISNIVFDHCRGLALETVDGGLLEDVAINNITMRDIVNAPIFLRLGRRMRGPKGMSAGELRRVNISSVVVYNADPRYPSIIAGIPDKLIEDVKLSNIRILYQGGGTKERAAIEPPERETNYPEASMFGDLPAYGFFIRHARGIQLTNVEVSFLKEDQRPAFVLDDVRGADFSHVKAQTSAEVPIFVLKNVAEFSTHECARVPDMRLVHVDRKTL